MKTGTPCLEDFSRQSGLVLIPVEDSETSMTSDRARRTLYWTNHSSLKIRGRWLFSRRRERKRWAESCLKTAKVCLRSAIAKAVVDKTFDRSYEQCRMIRIIESTPWSFPVLLVYRSDTRVFNPITQANVHPLPFRSDLISLVRYRLCISVVDCAKFSC